jgi:phosphatidylglycerophosphate synthase
VSAKWFRRRFPACRESPIVALRKSYGTKEVLDRQDSYISRFIYRPVSVYLTVPFVWMGCSANQVTVFRGVLALFSAVFLGTSSRSLVVTGALLYAFCVLLDYVDGNLARLNGNANDFGAFLEELADQVGPSLLPLAIGVGLYSRPDRLLRFEGGVHPAGPLLVGAVASIAYCLSTMAALYMRTMQVQVTGEYAAKMPKAVLPPVSLPARLTLLDLLRIGLKEGVYFAIVFGMILAAGLNLMSVYLLARALRNVTVFVLRLQRLARCLLEASSGACL